MKNADQIEATEFKYPKYQNLMYDVAFKNVFGNHKSLMIGLLNIIIKSKCPIEDLTFIQTDQNSFGLDGKRSICDVRCRLSNGEHVIIEVQLNPEKNFNKRIIFEACKEIAVQVKRSSDPHPIAYDFEPVFVVSIVNFSRNHDDDEIKNNDGGIVWEYSICNPNNGKKLEDVMSFYFVELGAFKKNLSELGTFEEKVYFCLKRIWELDSRPEEFSEEFFSELFPISEFESLNADQRQQYLNTMTWEQQKQSQLEEAKDVAKKEGRAEGRAEGLEEGFEEGHTKGLEEGFEEGHTKGLEEGFEEGHAKGLEEGRAEGEINKAISIAKEMLEKGMDIDLIVGLTKLNKDKVKAIVL